MLAEKPARGVLLSLERKMEESQPRMSTTGEFMSRMEGDTQTRRREKFINELKKHPNFKPSMLAPPKPKFKPVTLEGGPIVKEHSRRNTGLETKRPHQWGPLGGYY